jgi:hypothetical protein
LEELEGEFEKEKNCGHVKVWKKKLDISSFSTWLLKLYF